ncbi:glycerophosphodiester phosphodiesterase family protein [Micromonospora purpureochromogenes]|nr:glycerophosphodiester phosphodiesterase family protein [Micromonospora purpureochromogenes]
MRRTAIAALVVATVTSGLAAPAQARPVPERTFDLQAHRGGLGLRVENTLASFGNALQLGVNTLELDVQITEDGQAVVTHDRKVSGAKCVDSAPVRPGDPEFPYVGRHVNTLTLAQVRTLDCGSRTLPDKPGQLAVPGARMPLLREDFDLVKRYRADDVTLNVETKVEAGAPTETAPREQFVQVTAREIRAAGLLKQVTVQSFDWGALMRMRQAEPRLPLVALTNYDFLQVGRPARRPGSVAWTSTTSPATRSGPCAASARARSPRCTASRRTAPSPTPDTGRTSPGTWWSTRTATGSR